MNLEKRNHIKKHMRKLNLNGSITTDPFDILSKQQRGSFCQELCTSRNKNEDNSQMIECSLKDVNIPKLSEEQKVSCEGKITSEERALLLKSFLNNKLPGNDGIPIELYRKFWSLIIKPFIQCTNQYFEKGEMSCSQNQALITLPEKKRKRSLLSGKHYACVKLAIATRIKYVLPNKNHHNKTGFY